MTAQLLWAQNRDSEKYQVGKYQNIILFSKTKKLFWGNTAPCMARAGGELSLHV